MRIIKLIVFSILFFFLLITLISLFIPSRVRISKAIDTNAAREQVMALIKNPSRWKEWYPGADSLSTFEKDGAVRGFIIDSNSNSTIQLFSADDSIAVAGISGKRSILSVWEINGTGPVTIQWYLEFQLRWYPWEKFSSLFFEKVYGDQLERGLENLRQRAETARQ